MDSKLTLKLNESVIERAKIYASNKRLSLSRLIFSAIATNCDLIVTRNEKDLKNALIPILNCESYLQTLKK